MTNKENVKFSLYVENQGLLDAKTKEPVEQAYVRIESSDKRKDYTIEDYDAFEGDVWELLVAAEMDSSEFTHDDIHIDPAIQHYISKMNDRS